MTTEAFEVPMVNVLTRQRSTVKIQARDATQAIQAAQELNPGWAANFPVRRTEQWQ